MAQVCSSEPVLLRADRRSCAGWLPVCLLLIFLGTWGAMLAHPVPHSLADLRILPHRWQLDLKLPADRLGYALAHQAQSPATVPGPDELRKVTRGAVMSYVAARIAAQSDDGTSWSVYVDRALAPERNARDWRVTVTLTPPAGHAATSGWFSDEAILREIPAHVAVISLVEDWTAGVFPNHPRLLGALHDHVTRVHVDLEHDHPWRPWFDLMILGAGNNLQGIDHLAFLLAMILIVPLREVSGRWRVRSSMCPAWGQTMVWILAFALGQLVCIIAAIFGCLAPPSGPWMKGLNVLLVAISAVHAIRPLYPQREVWIAAGFGLANGFGFAVAIHELSRINRQALLATLDFNAGVVLVQLAGVLALAWTLIVFRARRWMPWVRVGLSAVATLAACSWAVPCMRYV